jgi:hypothetical protein
VLRIFIALKNPSPWRGSKAQPLGPVGSTLTTTPPRRPGMCDKDVNQTETHDLADVPNI